MRIETTTSRTTDRRDQIALEIKIEAAITYKYPYLQLQQQPRTAPTC